MADMFFLGCASSRGSAASDGIIYFLLYLVDKDGYKQTELPITVQPGQWPGLEKIVQSQDKFVALSSSVCDSLPHRQVSNYK